MLTANLHAKTLEFLAEQSIQTRREIKMNQFANAWKQHQEVVLTENGGLTYDTSANSNVDLFFAIGALRGQGTDRLYRLFSKAFGENPYIATRILLWARDVRGGAGERQVFRDLLRWLEKFDRDVLELVLPKIPEIGRWDDMIGSKEPIFATKEFREKAYRIYAAALSARNGLAAKWAPRNGPVANELRRFMKLTPKQYRKLLVALTDVVENKMCARDWENINYSHVPSLAQSRYQKAFLRHDELRYREFSEKAKNYAEAVASGDTEKLKNIEKVTINAGAVYPYDVLKPLTNYMYHRSSNDTASYDTIRAQWATLPNYVGDKNILPIIDVSGSMTVPVGQNLNVTCMDVAVSLGLYMATKNTGAFNNMFMTFSGVPELVHLKGDDIVNHTQQILNADWGMNTDLSAAFAKILDFSVKNRVPQADMPEYLIVFSDMEFDAAASGKTAYQDYLDKFENAGYRAPKIIWWNIQSRHDNVPVKFNTQGAALVSGFSPSLAKNIMSGESINPVKMMLDTIMDPRYDLDIVQNRAA